MIEMVKEKLRKWKAKLEQMRDNRLAKIVYMRRKQRERDRGGDPGRDGTRNSLLLMNDSMTVYKYYHNSIQCPFIPCFCILYLFSVGLPPPREKEP